MSKYITELANDIAKSCPDLAENGCGNDNCVGCLAFKLIGLGYQKQEWISVDERLPDRELEELRRQTKNPDKYYHCIIYICYETFGFVTDAWYGNDKFVGNHDYCPISNITHWMPLPEAPKMKGGAE